MRSHSTVLLAALLAAPVLSQRPATTPLAQQAGHGAVSAADTLRVPIHTETYEDEPGSREVWCAGTGYKASFHDGFQFVPVLGAEHPENLPWAWTTTLVSRGGNPVALEPARTPRCTDWRAEYALGPLTECYDVLPTGIEQTFVIPKPIGAGGDLWIEGRVDTRLRTQSAAPRHGALTFADADNTPIVEYGAAFAVDATGARTQMSTAFDNGSISLRLDGAWLDRATYPIVVDPLLTPRIVSFQADPSDGGCVVWDDNANRYVIAHTRVVSASDTDLYVTEYRPDLTGANLVHTSSSTGRSIRAPEITFVGGGQRWWVLVFEVENRINAPRYRIGYHYRISGSAAPMTSSLTYLPQNPGTSRRRPDVGGYATNTLAVPRAVIVFEEDPHGTNETPNTAIGMSVLTFGSSTGWSFPQYRSRFGQDHGYPAVNQVATADGRGWVVVWQTLDGTRTGAPWRLQVASISPIGSWREQTSNVIGPANANDHAMLPKVAGQRGQYVLTYHRANNTGTLPSRPTSREIRAFHFDWDGTSQLGTLEDFSVRSAAQPLRNVDLAADNVREANWCLVSQLDQPVFGSASMFLDRLVEDGVAESHTIGSPGEVVRGHGVCFNDDQHRFVATYSIPDGRTIYGVPLELPAYVPTQVYGTRCGPGSIAVWEPAYAGNRRFEVELSAGHPDSPCALLLSLGRANTRLQPLGFGAACQLYVDIGPSFIGSASTWTGSGGDAAMPLALPPSFDGVLYAQWVTAPSSAGVAGFPFSEGAQITVVR